MEKRNATCAVIGAGDYIGAEIAKKFAAEGFTVFAGDRRKFTGLIAAWPDDIRDHIVRLASGSDAVDPAHPNR